jgi:hypothetical protein
MAVTDSDPVVWIEFAANGNIRFWASDAARARVQAAGRNVEAFTLSALVNGRHCTRHSAPTVPARSGEQHGGMSRAAPSPGRVQRAGDGASGRVSAFPSPSVPPKNRD